MMDQFNYHTGEVATLPDGQTPSGKEAMLDIHHDESRRSRVTVAFGNAALSFMFRATLRLQILPIGWTVSVGDTMANPL